MDWLDTAYAEGPDPEPKRGCLGPAMGWFMDRHREGDYLAIDTVLRDVDLTRIAPVYMVTFLRINWLVHIWLKEWRPLSVRVRDELRRRGETDEKIARTLRGLLQDNLEPLVEAPEKLLNGAIALWPINGPKPAQSTTETDPDRTSQ